MELLHQIVKEALEAGMTSTGCVLTEFGNIGYEFNQFGKSGTALLVYDNIGGYVYCHTRYGQKDVIFDLEDFQAVQNEWVRQELKYQ